MMRKRDYGASSRGGGGDIISGLPDAILLEILSLLDMKHAVQTSVLSKRWRYLWASLRKLVFNAELFHSPNKNNRFDGFTNFVDQVLILRENSDIDMFRLTTSTFQDCDIKGFLDIWILAVTRRKVQKLFLCLWSDGIIRLPTCLFTCTSLMELALVMVMGGSERWRINLPKLMDLPNLKVLKLGFLVFHDENLTNNFFSSCPNLEVLSMENVRFQLMNVNICALKLQEFTVENHLHGNTYGYCRTQYKLYAPNLRYICCKDYMFNGYILENLSSLVQANIDLKLVGKEREYSGVYANLPLEWKHLYAQQMMQFLKGLQYVEDLKLSAWFLEVVSGSPKLLNSQQTKFCELTCLELKTCFARDTICAITYLLKISPVLESLSLEISKIQIASTPIVQTKQIASTNIDHYWEEVLPLHNLKFVTIRGVVGCVNELKFLEVLLKSAEVLENLKIFTSKESLPADREKCLMKYSDKLSTLPRASSNITIMVF